MNEKEYALTSALAKSRVAFGIFNDLYGYSFAMNEKQQALLKEAGAPLAKLVDSLYEDVDVKVSTKEEEDD